MPREPRLRPEEAAPWCRPAAVPWFPSRADQGRSSAPNGLGLREGQARSWPKYSRREGALRWYRATCLVLKRHPATLVGRRAARRDDPLPQRRHDRRGRGDRDQSNASPAPRSWSVWRWTYSRTVATDRCRVVSIVESRSFSLPPRAVGGDEAASKGMAGELPTTRSLPSSPRAGRGDGGGGDRSPEAQLPAEGPEYAPATILAAAIEASRDRTRRTGTSAPRRSYSVLLWGWADPS